MNSYLSFIALTAVLVVGQQAGVARADPVGFSLEEDPYSLDTRQRVRRGRAGIVLGSFGFIVGTLGIAVGVGTLTASESTGDYQRGQDPRVERKAGTTLLVVSPILIGVSTFAIVRSRRKLREVRPAPLGP